MEINFQLLGDQLFKAGLTDKPVNKYNKDEVEFLVSAVVYAAFPEKKRLPDIVDDELHIPYYEGFYWIVKNGDVRFVCEKDG